MNTFQLIFTTTNHMIQAISRIELARSIWSCFELGNFCNNFAKQVVQYQIARKAL